MTQFWSLPEEPTATIRSLDVEPPNYPPPEGQESVPCPLCLMHFPRSVLVPVKVNGNQEWSYMSMTNGAYYKIIHKFRKLNVLNPVDIFVKKDDNGKLTAELVEK